MFLSILNTVYQIVFLIFALWFAAAAVGYAVKAAIDRIKGLKEDPKPVEIKGPALDVIGEACEEFCNVYCKYHETCFGDDGDTLAPECKQCPLGKIL